MLVVYTKIIHNRSRFKKPIIKLWSGELSFKVTIIYKLAIMETLFSIYKLISHI